MSKSKFKVNIEVAVRARPLNNFECRDGEGNAWETKEKGAGQESGQESKVQGTEGQDKVICLKNKYRFGFNHQNQAEKRAPRGASNQRSRNNFKTTRSVSMLPYKSNTKSALDQSWKYVSGNIRGEGKPCRRAVSQYKSNNKSGGGFKPIGTPNNFTPTPFTQNTQLTPDNVVSEFNLDPVARHSYLSRQATGQGRGTSKEHLTRSKSLTAIQSQSQTKSGAGYTHGYTQDNIYKPRYAAYSTFKPQRSHSQFHTTRKPVARVRARSHMGKRSELSTFDPKRNGPVMHKQHKFKYDAVFSETETNLGVYKQTVRRVAMSALSGVNGTVFVYGNTGTGKTYTMMGHQRTKNEENSQHGANVEQCVTDENGQLLSERTRNHYDARENSGVLIYAMQDLFKKIAQLENQSKEDGEEIKFQLKLSYIEVYNEVVYDLLVVKKQDVEQNLTIQETKNKEFLVNGANQIQVGSIEQVLDLIEIGERNKHYAETFLNHCSSRSHTMFRLNVLQYKKQGNGYLQTKSYLNFVDLAGSERISNYFGGPKTTVATELYQHYRLKEGLSINKSLFNLTQVIHMLSQKPAQHIPYRNSTLTKLLRSSLGGNSRTSIIICITPAHSQVEQTISSLKFGVKAMKVQNSAKVQVNEIKLNALKNRLNLSLKRQSGMEHKIIQEIVDEYEVKIQKLERLLTEKSELQNLQQQVTDLQAERERLIQALELRNDRTFFTKQLMNKQRRGEQVLTLKYAGDVSIQSSKLALLSVEQLLEERDQNLDQTDFQEKANQKLVETLTRDLKAYKKQNTELKGECDELEKAYQEIIEQFAKMNQLQTELLKLKSGDSPRMEIQNIERLTDREIQRVDNDFKKQLNKIKQEKDKRNRLRRSGDNLSMNSSGHLKNFMRPYNPKSIYSTNRKASSAQSLSQKSCGSSPDQMNQVHSKERQQVNLAYQEYNDKVQVLHSESQRANQNHYNSRQGLSEEQILQNKNLNSTFGMKKQKKEHSQNKVPQIGSQRRLMEQIGGIHIDKSLYSQDNSYRPNTLASRSQSKEKNIEASLENKCKQESNLLMPVQIQPQSQQINLVNYAQQENLNQASQSPLQIQKNDNTDVPFGQIKNFNQYMANKQQQQFDIIKEEVQNENMGTSFDNLSQSHGFDISAPGLPGQTPSAFSNISGVQHVPGGGLSSNSSIKNVNIMIQQNLVFNGKEARDHQSSAMLSTPKKCTLQVEPELQEILKVKQSECDNNNTTFERSMSRLSGISQNKQPKSQYDQPHEINKDELMMEFQLDQLLSQNINVGNEANRSKGARKQSTKNYQTVQNLGKQCQVENSPQFSSFQHSHIIKQMTQTENPEERKVKPGHPRARANYRDYVSFQKEDNETFQNNFATSNKQSQKQTPIKGFGGKLDQEWAENNEPQQVLSNINEEAYQTSSSNQRVNTTESENLRAQIWYQQQMLYQQLHEGEQQESRGNEKSFSNNTSSVGQSQKPKSRKTRNMSIDLSSTIRKSPPKKQVQDDRNMDMFDQIDVDYNDHPLKYEDISRHVQEMNGYVAQQINNQQNINALEFYSDTLTPYGPIDTNDSHTDLQHNSQQEIDEEQLINVRIRTTKTTPKNDEDKENPRQFFNNNFQTKDDRPRDHEHGFGDQLIASEFKDATRSVENFIDENAQLLDTRLVQQNQNEAMLPMILYKNQSQIEDSSWNSKSQHKTSQDKSNSNSFQPNMRKELKQLEKSNTKLKKRGEQYQKLYAEMTAELKHTQRDHIEGHSYEVPDDRSSHSKKSGQKSMRTVRNSENVVYNYASNGSSVAQVKAQKKRKQSRENSNSLMSQSTTNALTSYENTKRNSRLFRNLQTHDNRTPHDSSSSLQVSHEFDIKSKVSGKSTLSNHTSNHTKNKSVKSKRKSKQQQTPNGQQDSSPLALQLLNQKLNQCSNQIDQDWQQKSQASLDKMQLLQKEYEKIKQRREQIMNTINTDSSPSRVLLMNDRPKMKNFEPVQIRKHSPNIKFDMNAEHLRHRSMREQRPQQQPQQHTQIQNQSMVGGWQR